MDIGSLPFFVFDDNRTDRGEEESKSRTEVSKQVLYRVTEYYEIYAIRKSHYPR